MSTTETSNRAALWVIILVATIVTAVALEYALGDPNVEYALVMGLATGLAADIAHLIGTNGDEGTAPRESRT